MTLAPTTKQSASTSRAPNDLSASRPLVFELVGPAGAGKSSVLEALAQRDSTLCAGIRLSRTERATGALRAIRMWGGAASSLLLSTPDAAPWALRHVVRARTLHEVLANAGAGRRAVILDEGPVFSLARLRSLGLRRTRVLLEHEADNLNSWSRALDGIIWLDADDAVLLQRIRQRAKPHRIKHSTNTTVRAFLDGYRRVYREVLVDFQQLGVPLHIFDTTQASAPEIVENVLRLIEATRREH